jgi:cytochrome d ubiquinol oxidase subunit II
LLFAWLAAVYLTVEAQDPALRRDFRMRALVTGLMAGAMSLVLLFIAGDGSPRLSAGLSHPVAVGLQLGVALVAAGALWALYRERYRLARVLAAAQVTVVVIGFGLAQWPHIIVPDMSFEAALAPESVVVPMLIVLACVAPILLVALVYLYRVFKAQDFQD